jgi:hypothetical protein
MQRKLILWKQIIRYKKPYSFISESNYRYKFLFSSSYWIVVIVIWFQLVSLRDKRNQTESFITRVSIDDILPENIVKCINQLYGISRGESISFQQLLLCTGSNYIITLFLYLYQHDNGIKKYLVCIYFS